MRPSHNEVSRPAENSIRHSRPLADGFSAAVGGAGAVVLPTVCVVGCFAASTEDEVGVDFVAADLADGIVDDGGFHRSHELNAFHLSGKQLFQEADAATCKRIQFLPAAHVVLQANLDAVLFCFQSQSAPGIDPEYRKQVPASTLSESGGSLPWVVGVDGEKTVKSCIARGAISHITIVSTRPTVL